MSRVGVVTVTYNSGKVLGAFLDCCERQQRGNWLLIVVDNASADTTREILRRRLSGNMHVIANDSNRGVAEGNNQGIGLARNLGCDRVLLINNDVEFSSLLFAELDSTMNRSSCDALVPRIVFHDQPSIDWFVGGHFEWLWGPDARHDRHISKPDPEIVGVRHIDYAPTCCMLVKCSVFDAIGLMDERYFVYWDDTDFCYRMHKAGITLLIDANIVMSHKVSSLTGGVSTDFFLRYHHRNQIYYVRKHFGHLVLAYTLIMSILKAALRVLVRGDSFRQFVLRLRSMNEGLHLPLGH